jgi:hypothetical protein
MNPPQAASTDRHANTLGDIVVVVRVDAGTEARAVSVVIIGRRQHQ